MLLQNDLRYSYVEARCLVINSTIVQKPCCELFQSESTFEARWLVQVRPNELDPTRYLGEVRQEFDRYYAAYDATITLHPVRFLFLVTDTTLFSAFSRTVRSSVVLYAQMISSIYAGSNHLPKELPPHYSASAPFFFSLSFSVSFDVWRRVTCLRDGDQRREHQCLTKHWYSLLFHLPHFSNKSFLLACLCEKSLYVFIEKIP